MIKEAKELIKIVGKGNLLEAMFIFLGAFQHANLDQSEEYIDRRNHNELLKFIQKSDEPLDKYFRLKFSLQGLFLIYTSTYKILKQNGKLNTQEVIDSIYEIIKKSQLTEELNGMMDERKLDTFNTLINPKGKKVFNINKDFEDKVLIEIEKLLNANATLNKYDEEFTLIRVVVNYFYSIHDIKIDKDIALLFSIGNDYKKLSPWNKTVKKEILKINKEELLIYIFNMANLIRSIEIKNKNSVSKHILNINKLAEIYRKSIIPTLDPINSNQGYVNPKIMESAITEFLNNTDSNKFEKMVVNSKNINYLAPQKGNNCLQDFTKKVREKHTNIGCKFIVSAFVLSIGLCTMDYFFMEQKLLSPIKNILPQDNITNLVIAAAFVIIMVAAVLELCKPQLQISEHNLNNIEATKKELVNGHS